MNSRNTGNDTGPDEPRDRPDEQAEASGDKTGSDVRAGPGDAGASDRPETLPRTAQSKRRGREASTLIKGLLIASAIIVLLLLLF